MRVTRETLIRIAKETAQERAYNDKDIIAAYLTGSLLGEEAILGGTADIDLILVHANKPQQSREIVKLSPDFHLDIGHRSKSEFKSPRELRTDPWLGYEVYDPLLLYEREKFLEFVQAGVRGGFEFNQPASVLQRCRKLHAHGRQIWFDLSNAHTEEPKTLNQFLKAVYHAVNAVAELSGPPLAERRLLMHFAARAEAAERPEIYTDLMKLLGVENLGKINLEQGLIDWQNDFQAAAESGRADARIHPARLKYYEKGIRTLLEGEVPAAAIWPLLQTWTLSATVLPQEQRGSWRNLCMALGLSGEAFGQRLEELDQFLDAVEILLDDVAAANGVEISPLL
ncbi:MAG: hypothetical protein ACP5QU_03380 [Anaerolineae bacterium]